MLALFYYRSVYYEYKSMLSYKAKLYNLERITFAKEHERQQQLMILDESKTKALYVAEKNNNLLRRQLISGSRRMYIRGKCAGMSQAHNHTTSSMDYDSTIQLSKNAGQNVLDLRAAIIRDNAKLSFLQKYISEQYQN